LILYYDKYGVVVFKTSSKLVTLYVFRIEL
jgi:hypothetical protein